MIKRTFTSDSGQIVGPADLGRTPLEHLKDQYKYLLVKNLRCAIVRDNILKRAWYQSFWLIYRFWHSPSISTWDSGFYQIFVGPRKVVLVCAAKVWATSLLATSCYQSYLGQYFLVEKKWFLNLVVSFYSNFFLDSLFSPIYINPIGFYS